MSILASAESRATIQMIAELNPELCDFGFGVYDDKNLDQEQRSEKLANDRARMFEDRSIEQFDLARGWLRPWAKTKQVNRGAGSSYGLKHRAQRDIGYVTNGVFIAAAYAEGFEVRRIENGPNALFNISTKAKG
jgi:hypothetical protein